MWLKIYSGSSWKEQHRSSFTRRSFSITGLEAPSESAALTRLHPGERSAVEGLRPLPYGEAGHSSLTSESNKDLIFEGNAAICPYHLS